MSELKWEKITKPSTGVRHPAQMRIRADGQARCSAALTMLLELVGEVRYDVFIERSTDHIGMQFHRKGFYSAKPDHHSRSYCFSGVRMALKEMGLQPKRMHFIPPKIPKEGISESAVVAFDLGPIRNEMRATA